MSDRLLGVLLFLPVPIVLFLFTRASFGLAGSLALGVALMLSHRFYARPFALARSARRCLWCGRATVVGPALDVEEPLGTTRWCACCEPHAERVQRFLAWAGAHRRFLQVGILGTLAAFLVAGAVIASGRVSATRYPDAVNAFRLAIAATVLPLGFLATRGRAQADTPLRPLFPVHLQALIGTWAVSWLFRLVGLAWLALAILHFALPSSPR
ncbi:MAG TPA: hypothetical protein VEQ84_03685 [Vicinamibacteria bacterium]|nr:hypothetical protein [Vicinamibacteria bacterium]